MQACCIWLQSDGGTRLPKGGSTLRQVAFAVGLLASACEAPTVETRWQVVTSGQPEAILSVAGSRDGSIWFVGADRGHGPLVVRHDGTRFVRHDSGHRGDLWWVQAFDDGSALMAGSDGSVLRYRDGAFERLSTPGLGKQTLFGLAGQRPDDVWFVGGAAGRDGFLWHLRGTHFDEVPLPLDVPRRVDGELPSVLKSWVSADGQAWFVGDRGLLLHAAVGAAPRLLSQSTRERWFTIAGRSDAIGEAAEKSLVAVGGNTLGHLLEWRSGFAQLQPEGLPLLQGVFVDARGAIAVGQFGAVFERGDGDWQRQDPELSTPITDVYAALVADEQRNRQIVEDVTRSVRAGRSPILLMERRDHLDYFASRLRSVVNQLVILHGGMSAKERRTALATLSSLPDSAERLILATGRYIGEGFDDARLDTLFLAMPVAWKGTLVQYAGRLQRLHPDKTEVRIFDYVDRKVPVLARMFDKRLRGYRSIGYTPDDMPFVEEISDPWDEDSLRGYYDANLGDEDWIE